MKCERCEKAEATVQQITIVNDQVTHKRLCEECAKEEETDSSEVPGASVSNIISNLFDEDQNQQKPNTCDRCGMTFEEFRKEERFGCANCYDQFEGRLKSLIHRIHGADQHVGTATKSTKPAKISDERKIKRLRKRLQQAVEAEQYEEAADLRDRIHRLEDTNDED